ncbi:MAG: hypothetical protein E6G60_14330 [Actinobacteria bacterium]|nr:MAG: hypothetical protein E6G60_14330 [Actinomycetota bacterium]
MSTPILGITRWAPAEPSLGGGGGGGAVVVVVVVGPTVVVVGPVVEEDGVGEFRTRLRNSDFRSSWARDS